MQTNKLRQILSKGLPSTATRLVTTWPFFMELIGSTGAFDYAEFVAEYAPFSQADLENLARAAELHGMGSIIKIDFLNREYVAQKAVGAGFQGILFSDHRSAEQVRESVRCVKPDTPGQRGLYGLPTRRFIGTQSFLPQLDHAQRLEDIVLLFMIEKKSALDEIEEICRIPGVDMVQFGPADYSLSMGWNMKEHIEEVREAERKMIKAALASGVQPRCEIQTVEAAQYYIDLGVRHFCFGDQVQVLHRFWQEEGARMRGIADILMG